MTAAARRAANATFYQSHAGDEATALVYAVDLTPLAYGADLAAFAREKLENFRKSLHVEI